MYITGTSRSKEKNHEEARRLGCGREAGDTSMKEVGYGLPRRLIWLE